MNKLITYFLVLTTISCAQFSSKTTVSDENTLAKVEKSKLYVSDIPKNLFRNTDTKDSAAILKKFIENWIKSEIITLKAKKKISDINAIQFEAKSYEKSLINASYKKELLNSLKIDLKEEDLKAYYELHKDYFIFEEEYVSLNYILLPKSTSNIAKIKKAINNSEESHWVENYCKTENNKCYLEKEAVKPLSFVAEKLKLKKEKIVPLSSFKYQYIDAETIMLYKVNKMYKVGDIAPQEIVEKELLRLTLHEKKQKHYNEIVEKLIQKAKNDKIIEKHNN